jgi:hypothetical protein
LSKLSVAQSKFGGTQSKPNDAWLEPSGARSWHWCMVEGLKMVWFRVENMKVVWFTVEIKGIAAVVVRK